MRAVRAALPLAATVLVSACAAEEPPRPAAASPSPVSTAPAEPSADTSTALVLAAERGDAALGGRLLRAGAAVDDVDGAGRTALEAAVASGAGLDTVRVLVAAGAGVAGVIGTAQGPVLATLAATDRPPADPGAALLAAATAGDADTAAVALRAGADLEVRAVGDAPRCCLR